MRIKLTALAMMAAVGCGQPAFGQSLPELLIVGTPHFSNPGQDLVNTVVPDVTTPQRQHEIEVIVSALAMLRPTRVALEWPATRQEQLDQRYADYLAGRYSASPSERDQIGLRLAATLKLDRVHGVDWNEMPPGSEADYNFVAWADRHGRIEAWNQSVRAVEFNAKAERALMDCTPVTSWLRRRNASETRATDHMVYYSIAELGDPGAAWVGTWYARNLRILRNLRSIAKNGVERIVVVYGAGHSYLLEQQARESGWFRVLDPLAYLPTDDRDSRTHCPD